MYHSGDDDSYELVSGSLYSVTVEDDIDSYTCRDIFLNSSEYFSIQQGDMLHVGVELTEWNYLVADNYQIV